jgi:hypothetical protein
VLELCHSFPASRVEHRLGLVKSIGSRAKARAGLGQSNMRIEGLTTGAGLSEVSQGSDRSPGGGAQGEDPEGLGRGA